MSLAASLCAPVCADPPVDPNAAQALGPPPVLIQPAEPDDWTFLDGLQRAHPGALGFLSRAALGEAVARGRVLLAREAGAPVGYVYGAPRYQRRPDVAIVFQVAVRAAARGRGLGAALVRAFADQLPEPAVQLSLWCAEDLGAGRFWSALGFVPVARRAGARGSGRSHLFWCRTRSGAAISPGAFWAPRATGGGLARTARVVVRVG